MSGRRHAAAQRLLSHARNAGRRAERAYGPAGNDADRATATTATLAEESLAARAAEVGDRAGLPERL